MILFLRLLVYITPLVLTGLSSLLFFFPDFWHMIILGSGVFMFLVILLLHQGISFGTFVEFFITPPLAILGVFGFLLFIENTIIFFGSVVATAALVGIFLDSLYAFQYDQERFQPRSLANTTSSLNILAIFFIASALFGLLRFLNQPVWALLLVWLAAVALSTLSAMVVNMISFKKSQRAVLIASIILLELFWVFVLSPLGMFVSAIVLVTAYYIIVNLARYHERDALDRSIIKRYLIIGSSVIILTLVSAPWI